VRRALERPWAIAKYQGRHGRKSIGQRAPWTIPKERKRDKELVVPLSNAAIMVLKRMHSDGGLIFSVDEQAMLRLLKQMRPQVCVHGSRAVRLWRGIADLLEWPHRLSPPTS
jgi:integrase